MKEIKDIHALEQEIRDLINYTRIQTEVMKNSADWIRLCSSLDIIGDTQLAISAFNIDNLGDDLMDGNGYLHVYGLLQATFLQQDAVKHISLSLGLKFDLSPHLRNIREIRNDTIGHPTNRNNGKYFCFINRSSIKKGSFTYFKENPKRRNYSEIPVDIEYLIQLQNKEISIKLNEIIESLKRNINTHHAKYKDVKMIEIFPNTLDWFFLKIDEAINNPKLRKIGVTNIKYIRDIIPKLDKELRRRDDRDSADWFDEYISEIEFPLNQIELYLKSDSKCEINNQTAHIFVFYLKHIFNEMKENINEIDVLYNSNI